MKLKMFPLLEYCFQQIDLDNAGKIMVNPEAEVPDLWHNRFVVAERALQALAGKTMHDLGIAHQHECAEPDYKALDMVAAPPDEFQWDVYRAAGICEGDAKTAEDIFHHYFDGDLREVFHV